MSRAPWNNWFAWQPICSRNRPLRNGIVAAERHKMHFNPFPFLFHYFYSFLLSFPSSNIKKFHHLRKFPSDGMTLHFISCCCFLQNNKDRQQQTILLSQYKVMTSPFQNRKPDAYKAGRQSLLEVPPLRIHIRTQYSAIPFSPSKSSLPVWV